MNLLWLSWSHTSLEVTSSSSLLSEKVKSFRPRFVLAQNLPADPSIYCSSIPSADLVFRWNWTIVTYLATNAPRPKYQENQRILAEVSYCQAEHLVMTHNKLTNCKSPYLCVNIMSYFFSGQLSSCCDVFDCMSCLYVSFFYYNRRYYSMLSFFFWNNSILFCLSILKPIVDTILCCLTILFYSMLSSPFYFNFTFDAISVVKKFTCCGFP